VSFIGTHTRNATQRTVTCRQWKCTCKRKFLQVCTESVRDYFQFHIGDDLEESDRERTEGKIVTIFFGKAKETKENKTTRTDGLRVENRFRDFSPRNLGDNRHLTTFVYPHLPRK